MPKETTDSKLPPLIDIKLPFKSQASAGRVRKDLNDLSFKVGINVKRVHKQKTKEVKPAL